VWAWGLSAGGVLGITHTQTQQQLATARQRGW